MATSPLEAHNLPGRDKRLRRTFRRELGHLNPSADRSGVSRCNRPINYRLHARMFPEIWRPALFQDTSIKVIRIHVAGQ